MSFGWSAGDIVAALQLLRKVATALKDTGGASSHYQDVASFLSVLSVTLEHLKALQTAPLDPDLAQTLAQLCEEVQEPVTSFCCRIRSSFEQDLGAGSTRLKFLTTGRKLKWALSTSKKVKDLREKIGGPIAAMGIVLGQQIVQTTLQMPFEVQARIAHTIDTAVDTRINPLTLDVHNEVKALLLAQQTSSQLIEKTVQSIGISTGAGIQKLTLDLENRFNNLSISHGMFLDLSTRQSQSTDIVLRSVQQAGRETAHAIQRHNLASRERNLSIHKKLDNMTWLMGAVKDRMGDLSIAQQSARFSTSKSEIEKAIGNIRRSVWLLISALHILIRELIYLLAPYLVALYRTSIQPLLLCGDHFFFEDAIGRRKWLPCLQFQHWDNFYHLLIDIFQGEAGLSRVLNGQFMLLNAFNEVPINKKAWRAGIHPKCRVVMAVMLNSAIVQKGRCVNPSCPGQVDFGADDITRICPICGKHLSTLKDSTSDNEDYGSEAGFSFDFGSDIKIPIMKDSTYQETQLNKIPLTAPKYRFPTDAMFKDIAAFKRVIYQVLDQDGTQEYAGISDLQASEASERLRSPPKTPSLRPRGIPARQKPSTRGRKADHSSSDRRDPPASVEQEPSNKSEEAAASTTPSSIFPNSGIRPKLPLRRRNMGELNAALQRMAQSQDRNLYIPQNQKSEYHALQDYQMQLMLLEQQNQERLRMARQE